MVHKGEMVESGGTVKAVAIKTIKCEVIINLNICIYTHVSCATY